MNVTDGVRATCPAGYYKGKGILKDVDGTKDMDVVFQAITDILGA